MLFLLFFAFLAGVFTVLSPCVLPVLPVILATGADKQRLKPLGMVLGLVLSFSLFTLFIAQIAGWAMISANTLRLFAIGIIALFGIVMIFPRLSNWFSSLASPIADLGTSLEKKSKYKGFFGGLIIGCALGLLWTPCAGPILAAVTALAASKKVSWESAFITFAYSLGAAVPMLLIAYGSQKMIASSKWLSRHAEAIRKVFGVAMLLTALALAFHLDEPFQQKIANYLPALAIEKQKVVQEELEKLRGTKSFKETESDTLPLVAPAIELQGISSWINTPPVKIEDLKGKVVLIDFWTYSCINCLRTLPYLKDWNKKYKDKGLVIIGVHTPEFAFEKERKNVEEATKRLEVTYPVALDNDYATWNAYSNMYWPAHYLIDQTGMIRDVHFGEGKYLGTENAIRKLLGLEALSRKEEPTLPTRPITRETYLGFQRALSYMPGTNIKADETADYINFGTPGDNEIGLTGKWEVEGEKIISQEPDATLNLNFMANRVYLVMDGTSTEPVKVLLDGKPLKKDQMTADMNAEGQILVKEPRKYDVVNLKGDKGRHLLTLIFPKGLSAYAFTFGDEE